MPDLWTAYNSGKKVYDEDEAQYVTELLARVRIPNSLELAATSSSWW